MWQGVGGDTALSRVTAVGACRLAGGSLERVCLSFGRKWIQC